GHGLSRAHWAGEPHRQRVESLMQGVVLGVAADAVHFAAGLLDGVAAEAVQADPEAGPRTAGPAMPGGLDPARRDLLVGLAVSRVAGPVRGLGVSWPAARDHWRGAVHGGSDH